MLATSAQIRENCEFAKIQTCENKVFYSITNHTTNITLQVHVDDSNINPKFKWVNNGEEEPEKFKKIGEDTDDKAIEDEVKYIRTCQYYTCTRKIQEY